jgi:hypothetical protein
MPPGENPSTNRIVLSSKNEDWARASLPDASTNSRKKTIRFNQHFLKNWNAKSLF